MRADLRSQDWLERGEEQGLSSLLNEDGYRACVGSDISMKLFIERVAAIMGLKIDDRGGLAGFSQYYDGSENTQSLEAMSAELPGQGFLSPAPERAAAMGWKDESICDGHSAEGRVAWLVSHEGKTEFAARLQVISEFPSVFGGFRANAMCDGALAGDRVAWLQENEGLTEGAARLRVVTEFPEVFFSSGDYIACSFPHSCSLVCDRSGQKRLRITVTPSNPSEVDLVAFHYGIDTPECSMNFDVTHYEPGTQTMVHVTPDFGPTCSPGQTVHYWLCGRVNGLLQNCPEGAMHGERMTWTAH